MHPQSQKARLSPSLLVQRGMSVALALCLLSPPLPVLAADDDEAALAKAETILFGEPSKDGDIEDRIERVEKRVFGRRKSGSDEVRIERLVSTLLIDRKQLPAANKPQARAEPASVTAETAPVKVESSAPISPAPTTAVESTSQSTAQSAASASPEASSTKPESQTEVKTAELHKEDSKAKLASEKPVLSGSKLAVQKTVPLRGKGAKGARLAGNTAAQPAIKGMPGVSKKTEITLTRQTAAMDELRPENPRPSLAASPYPGVSTSANRIARKAPPKVSQVTALLREGMEAHRKGEDARAEQLFKRVVLLEPRNPDGYFNLGAIAEKKHDLAAALMSYRAALILSPNDKELREAVDSVESMISAQTGGRHLAGGRKANAGAPMTKTAESKNSSFRNDESRIDDYKSLATSDANRVEAKTPEVRTPETSDQFAPNDGSYGFGQRAQNQNDPAPASNFYRANAKTTRELQEEANPMADVSEQDGPEMPVTQPDPPVINTSSPAAFQLQTQQSQAMTQATHRGHPVASVATRAFLGAALGVGTSFALRSTGLHCPICRLGGGRAVRGFMRF